MKLISVISKRSDWQKIRISLLGTWTKAPAQNVQILRKYLCNYRYPYRNRVVLNYLTGSGFRSGKIKHSTIDILVKKLKTVPRMLKNETSSD